MDELNRWQSILALYEDGQVSSKGDRRVLQLVESACDLIAKDGYEALDFGTLARKCKVTRPLVNHYFKSKEELFRSVVQWVGIEHQKYILAALPTKPKSRRALLRAYLEINLKWPQERKTDSRVWMHYLAQSAYDKRAKLENTRSVDHGARRIREILQLGAVGGEWSAEDLQEKSRGIQVLLTGAVISLITEERTEEDAFVLARVILRQSGHILGTVLE